jgi:ATP adenylyltransferase
MNFQELNYFIVNKMRMSHIYQPVMLMKLLESGGECSETEIARSILAHDQSQIEYYQNVTRNMVGSVLRKHKIVEKIGKLYRVIGFEKLRVEEIDEIKKACESRLSEYLEKRGQKIWEHRKQSSEYISGTLKYEVLKAAGFHCELCGISADIKALEVDHIIPRSKGGTDDLFNLQALCYSCNAMKRDRDDTDFRKIRESYMHRDKDCAFCQISKTRKIEENELAYAILDGFPVTPYHTLIIPKRHVSTYFEITRSESNACHSLINKAKRFIEKEDSEVSGFNIGINNGESAGQTILHCHIHLIPRRKNDVEKPRGGIRNIIPGKGDY